MASPRYGGIRPIEEIGTVLYVVPGVYGVPENLPSRADCTADFWQAFGGSVVITGKQLGGRRVYVGFDAGAVLVDHLHLIGAVVRLDLLHLVALRGELVHHFRR